MKKILASFTFLLLISLRVYSQTNYVPNVTVSTFSGVNLTRGNTDGQGTGASFDSPSAIAIDASGNAYVADQVNNEIRKITPQGLVSTFAGLAASGSANGQGTSASFFWPSGIAIDASGNLYVADEENNLIRKISPEGLVTTLAGSGLYSSTDGQGTAASFAAPQGVAVDASGNVYVADSGNNLIRKITPGGLVSTFAGSTSSGSADGQGVAAGFKKPTGITVDANGNIYVADFSNNLIRKITSGGLVSTLAGSTKSGSVDGQGAAASFNNPSGIAVDVSGNIYVADYENNEIRKVTSEGLVTTLAGSTTPGSADGDGATARFYLPYGIAVDASGNLYVVDAGNEEIRKVNESNLTTSIFNNSNVSAITIFPNPAKNILNIILPNEANGTLSLSDIHGSLILTKPISGKQITLLTDSLEDGIYALNIVSDNASYITRVVITK
jgi:sugar lactone lactonase YvrE